MRYSKWLAIGSVYLLLASGACMANEGNVDELKQQIEQLETKLSLAEKSAELLEKECEQLRKENAQLKGDKEPLADDENDGFSVGVVWVGEAKASGESKAAKWALSVSERKGRNFSGAIAIVLPNGKKAELPVSGTAPTNGIGAVVMESPQQGFAKLFFRGRLVNGEMALVFSGTSGLGKKLFGAATLRPTK